MATIRVPGFSKRGVCLDSRRYASVDATPNWYMYAFMFRVTFATLGAKRRASYSHSAATFVGAYSRVSLEIEVEIVFGNRRFRFRKFGRRGLLQHSYNQKKSVVGFATSTKLLRKSNGRGGSDSPVRFRKQNVFRKFGLRHKLRMGNLGFPNMSGRRSLLRTGSDAGRKLAATAPKLQM